MEKDYGAGSQEERERGEEEEGQEGKPGEEEREWMRREDRGGQKREGREGREEERERDGEGERERVEPDDGEMMPTRALSLLLALSGALCVRVPTVRMLGPSERVAAVLLAGGSGKRMGATDSKGKPMPKQFLELDGKSVLQLSIELLQRVEGLAKLVVVLAPEFRTLDFVAAAADADERIVFAPPGAERQNSVENGLAMVDDSCTLVAVHDAARPLVTLDEIHRCLDDAAEHGAAVSAPSACASSPVLSRRA